MSDTLRSTERLPAPADGAYSRLLRRLGSSPAWDGAIAAVAPLADRLVAQPPVRRLFHGDATGVPLHGILTDAPLGAWFLAMYLDLYRDDASRLVATRLVGLGVAAAVPTAVAGWAEWAGADRATRRLGMTHASLQGLSALVFAASWAARRQGRHRLGIALARLGSVPNLAGNFLGGSMGSGRRRG
ncbi:DUF2231 domain-containing protein [Geodermatophilus sp. SYSU D00815]